MYGKTAVKIEKTIEREKLLISMIPLRIFKPIASKLELSDERASTDSHRASIKYSDLKRDNIIIPFLCYI